MVREWIYGGTARDFLGGMQTIAAGESVVLTIEFEADVEYTAIDFTTESIETFAAS
jgi:hypothetical protein